MNKPNVARELEIPRETANLKQIAETLAERVETLRVRLSTVCHTEPESLNPNDPKTEQCGLTDFGRCLIEAKSSLVLTSEKLTEILQRLEI
jgi:hypothetical protein